MSHWFQVTAHGAGDLDRVACALARARFRRRRADNLDVIIIIFYRHVVAILRAELFPVVGEVLAGCEGGTTGATYGSSRATRAGRVNFLGEKGGGVGPKAFETHVVTQMLGVAIAHNVELAFAHLNTDASTTLVKEFNSKDNEGRNFYRFSLNIFCTQ